MRFKNIPADVGAIATTPSRRKWTMLLLALFAFAIPLSAWLRLGSQRSLSSSKKFSSRPKGKEPGDAIEGPELRPKPHPIEHLIEQAGGEFDRLLSERTHKIEEVAVAYRKRRGRHPPPRFDRWYEFADKHDAIFVEEFFDPIYHNLGPFWGKEPLEIKREAHAINTVITVRNGNATCEHDSPRTRSWLDLVQSIAHLLPDLDMPVNTMDETRLVVPWDQMSAYMAAERDSRQILPVDQMKEGFRSLEDFDFEIGKRKITWEEPDLPHFARARRGCAPESQALLFPIQDSWEELPELSMMNAQPHLFEGFVANTTLATDICHQPDLQSTQGIFIEPVSLSTSPNLYPLFAETKLSTNNEILIPSAVYWDQHTDYSDDTNVTVPWTEKHPTAVWRGANAGGRNHVENWTAFQRPRFISMVNGTKISNVEAGRETPVNFRLPPSSPYHLHSASAGRLGEHLSQFTDIGLTIYHCFPTPPDPTTCPYAGSHLALLPQVPMAQQYLSKYLPDIDGNTFSGRYRAFLLSTSLPIKATIFQEWHDSRLVAWKHYVPMDVRFEDFYAISEFFLGVDLPSTVDTVADVVPTDTDPPSDLPSLPLETSAPPPNDKRDVYHHEQHAQHRDAIHVPGHDELAERIASEGREWAEKVLRPEDMQIYMYRLLLEYARVMDEDRDRMGWVQDLKTGF